MGGLVCKSSSHWVGVGNVESVDWAWSGDVMLGLLDIGKGVGAGRFGVVGLLVWGEFALYFSMLRANEGVNW